MITRSPNYNWHGGLVSLSNTFGLVPRDGGAS
jgi:hypothetical protein